jgi:hypothetical protein
MVMSADGERNGTPEVKAPRPGTFQKGNKAAKGSSAGKGKGVTRQARKHATWTIKQLRHMAEHSKSETARQRAMELLLKYAVGTPASAEQMGTVEPVASFSNPAANGIADWNDRRIGTAEGAEDVRTMLERIAAEGYAHLSPLELDVLRDLRTRMGGDPVPNPAAVIIRRQRHMHEALAEPYVDVNGILHGTVPGLKYSLVVLPAEEADVPEGPATTPEPAPSELPAEAENAAPASTETPPEEAVPNTPPPCFEGESWLDYCWRLNNA